MKAVKRIAIVTIVIAAVWLFAGFATAQTACAHDPRFSCSPRPADRAVTVPDPEKSWAFYGRLAPSEHDVYSFRVEKQIAVPVSLLIEKADAGRIARPSLVLQRAGGPPSLITFRENAPFHEPFSGIEYLTTPDRTYVLEPGSYVATVTMSGGDEPQRYVFAIGEAERFGVAEIPYVLGAVYRVKTRGF